MPKICFLLPKRFLPQLSPGAARLSCYFPKLDIGVGHELGSGGGLAAPLIGIHELKNFFRHLVIFDIASA